MASALLEQPDLDTEPAARSAHSPAWARYLLPGLIVVLILVMGIAEYAGFWGRARDLWTGICHDRSAHYDYGLRVAMDLRHGNLRGLLHDLDGARVWGPLHGPIVAAIELVAGPDMRLAVLPSWLSWMATAWLAFLLGRRLVPEGGGAAGFLAAWCVLLSPGHRAYATDCMLESLGAALSLACLYAYVRLVQDGGARPARWLAVALTVLFLTKQNYWLLVVIGLVFSELASRGARYRARAWALVRRVDWRGWAARQLRHPLTWLMALAGAAAAWVIVTGGTIFHLGSTRIQMNTPHNLIHVAYLALFVRLLGWWRRPDVRAERERWPAPLRTVLVGHGWAVAIYFLLPKRLANFFWFLSLANNDQSQDTFGLLHGWDFHLTSYLRDYSVTVWSGYLLLGLAVLGLATCWRWRPGSGAVVCFLVVSAALTIQHPMLRSRYLHSWLATLWIVAGAGGAYLLAHLLRRVPMVQKATLAVCCAAFAAAQASWAFEPGHAQERSAVPRQPCLLTLSDAYLDELTSAQHATLLCNVHTPFFLSWTFLEHCGHQRYDTEIKGYTSETAADAELLVQWAAKTPSDAVVLIDIAPDSPFYTATPDNKDQRAARAFLGRGAEWRLQRTIALPEKVTITVWRKRRPV